MFGSGNVTSSWANPQQNQQPQQPSAFGQPSTFGSGGAFGSGSAFGQNPQQPQANPMFGGLGGTPNTSTGTGTGFGAFGGSTTQAANPMFGAARPSTGFGAFSGGGSTTFGGGGTFGTGTTNTASSSGTGTGLFGQPANASTSGGAFGTGGLFGAKPATAFGSTTNTTEPAPPVTTGTSNPVYSVFSEKDPANANATLYYQGISAMPAYRGCSFEELRLQDYQQGRKTAGAFGQSAAFGTTQPSGGIFGTQPAQNTTQPAANPMFGGGAFGAGNTNQPAASGGGAFGSFGQSGNSTQTGTGSGLFGSSTAFGQPQQQQTTAFGTFGQPQQQQQQQQQQSGGGLFGNTGAFGQKPASTFGGTGAFGTGGAFGQQPQQPQPAGGLFGQQQQQQSTTNAFGNTGAFGTNTNKPSIFGQSAQPATQPNTGFGAGGIFGTGQQQQNQQGQQQQQPAGGLFGGGGGLFGQNANQQQQQPAQQTGVFGNTQAGQQPAGGLFGSTSGGGLFGSNQQQQQNQQQPAQTGGFGGLFGQTNNPAQPTTGSSLFSGLNQNKPATPNPLFGSSINQSNNQQPNTSAFGGGLFGNKQNAPALGTSQSTQPGGLGSSVFGTSFGNSGSLTASTSNPGAQGTLTASISQPIATNLPIFSMLPPGPRAYDIDQGPKKKPPFFVENTYRSPVPRLGLSYSAAGTKLRGFGDSRSTTTVTYGPGGPVVTGSFTEGKPNVLTLTGRDDIKISGQDSFLARSSSPALGSGNRSSVKKLILDKKPESDLFNQSGGSQGFRSSGSKVNFSPALGIAARERDAAAAASSPPKSPTQPARSQGTPNRFTARSTHNVLDYDAPPLSSPAKDGVASEGDYWVKPDLQTLIHSGHDQLISFEGLVVGRVGYGEIHFLEPVDLTGLPKLSALFGQVIKFEDKECSVYPDNDDVDKPPPGTGLNVRAKIILLRCWTLDKATREPIKDEKHPAAVKHRKRLSKMKDTHFEGFDIEEGKWTFTVDHF